MSNRIDWSKQRRKARPYIDFEFEDSNLDEPIKISLRKLLTTEIDACDERAETYIAKYVTGGWTNLNGDWCKEPVAFPPMDEGEPITLNATSIRTMCRIEAMQPPGGHEFADLVYMSYVATEAYPQIDMLSFAVQAGKVKEKDGQQGNQAGEA